MKDYIRAALLREALLSVLDQDDTSRELTATKAALIIERDARGVTGFVLTSRATGNRAIVDMSAVRWLSKAEMWGLMHLPDDIRSLLQDALVIIENSDDADHHPEWLTKTRAVLQAK